jgi:hypothetical protein
MKENKVTFYLIINMVEEKVSAIFNQSHSFY